MRTYEALYIVDPSLDDAGIQTIVTEVEGLVTGSGGAIVRSEIWGKRKLAYEVKKFTDGYYVLLRFDAETEILPKLEQHFRLSDSIFRYLLVLLDEKTLKLEAAEQARREADNARPRSDDDDDDDDDDDRPRRRGSRDDRDREHAYSD